VHGQPGWVAALTPFSVDGMIVAASPALLRDTPVRAGPVRAGHAPSTRPGCWRLDLTLLVARRLADRNGACDRAAFLADLAEQEPTIRGLGLTAMAAIEQFRSNGARPQRRAGVAVVLLQVPLDAISVYPEHDLFIQQAKRKNTFAG
jgi:hypothetical protein